MYFWVCYWWLSVLVTLGNDLARVLRWGAGYTGGEDPLNLLRDVIDAEEIRLDRWTVVFHPEDKADADSAKQVNSTGKKRQKLSKMKVTNEQIRKTGQSTISVCRCWCCFAVTWLTAPPRAYFFWKLLKTLFLSHLYITLCSIWSWRSQQGKNTLSTATYSLLLNLLIQIEISQMYVQKYSKNII